MNASDQDGQIIRRRRFAQVPDELIIDQAVTDFAARLWCRLDRYAGQDGRAFPHLDRLAEDMHASPSKIKRGLRNLVDTGWITRKRRGFSNIIDTYLNDEPIRHRRSETSPQVASEGSDLAFPEGSDLTSPEGSDLTLPKKENHSKEMQLKERSCGRGGVSSHQRGDAASSPPEDRPPRSAQPQPRQRPAPPPEPLPDIPPATCPRHAGGNPGDEPCRACGDARKAHDRARAARADILAKRDHAAVHAAMNEAARTAVRLPKGFLREHMTRPGDARGDPVATP